MKFYDCSTAPSPRRVRILMAEKGIEIPTVQVDLRGGEHLGETFRRINPQCTVPVLELDSGACLTSSNAISFFLDEIFPDINICGSDPEERGIVSSWNHYCEWDGFFAAAEAFRNATKGFKGRAMTGPANIDQIPELAARGRARSVRFLETLDARLATSAYFANDRFTLADITAYVAVDFMAWAKIDVPDDASHLKRWFQTIAQRPGTVT